MDEFHFMLSSKSTQMHLVIFININFRGRNTSYISLQESKYDNGIIPIVLHLSDNVKS